MNNYFDDYKGQAQSDTVELPANRLIRLPDRPCKRVRLSNWTVTDGRVAADGTLVAEGGAPYAPFSGSLGAATGRPADAADGSELYYGFGDNLAHQLFVGESVEFEISNLSQIVVRSTPGISGVIYFTWFN
jgi:hypothetical protein